MRDHDNRYLPDWAQRMRPNHGICPECGAMVNRDERSVQLHDEWHEKFDAARELARRVADHPFWSGEFDV